MVKTDASVRLDFQRHVGNIDGRIFGGFAEHIGRLIYGGLYDPDNALSDEHGFRRDVLEALKPLDMPVMRYPGGNFVSAYDWRDGIGPRERRPARPDFAWKSIEPNAFGVDEFVTWCRMLGTDPLMVVNLGTGTPRDAAELVEYCNLPGGTYWSERRIAHGCRAPHAIKLWGLGNEMDGPWQAGHVPADVYARRAAVSAQLMKGLDPSIELVAAGSTACAMPTYMEWDRIVLDACWDQIDYLSAHNYSHNRAHDTPRFLGTGLFIDRQIEDYGAAIRYMQALKKTRQPVHIAFDEWNVWYHSSDRPEPQWWSTAPPWNEEIYNFEDALVVAQYLNSFIRHADMVKIACVAQIVNVIALLLTRPDGLLRQTIYYAFELISRRASGVALVPLVTTPTYKANEYGDVPMLDASAAYDAERQGLALFLVNRSIEQELSVAVRLQGGSMRSVTEAVGLYGHDPDVGNTWEQPLTVVPKPIQAGLEDGALHVRLPAPSMAALVVETAEP